MIDCQLLKEVYINLIDQKEPKLNLENSNFIDNKFKSTKIKNNKKNKVIKISSIELESHKKFLKSSLPKNYFS